MPSPARPPRLWTAGSTMRKAWRCSTPRRHAPGEAPSSRSDRGKDARRSGWRTAHACPVRRLFAIDPHVNSREDPAARTLDEFSANIRRAGVADVVKPLVMTTREAARAIDGGVEILFIDGDHSDAGAAEDATLWLPRLIDGATVLMHDVVTASYTGPRRVFRRRICWDSGYAGVRRVGSMGIARRVARRSVADAAWGTMAGLLLYLLDAKRLIRRFAVVAAGFSRPRKPRRFSRERIVGAAARRHPHCR